MDTLQQLGAVPVDIATLKDLFPNYKSIRDKVSMLETEGRLIRLKRGLYVVAPIVSKKELSTGLIANHIYGPSYVSMESALRLYGLIPENVYTVKSMTTKRYRKFQNKIATFEYISANIDYYHIGINQMATNEGCYFLISSPEKALCDLIITTHRLNIQSVKSTFLYLRDDLRLDMEMFYAMDIKIFRQCVAVSKKKSIINNLIKLLER